MDLIHSERTDTLTHLSGSYTHTHTHRRNNILRRATVPLMDVHTIRDEKVNGKTQRKEITTITERNQNLKLQL